MDAKPQMTNFTWYFNGLPINHSTSTNSLQNVLTITFNNRNDFGQYLCFAENVAGISAPCKIQVIPYGKNYFIFQLKIKIFIYCSGIPESITECYVLKSNKEIKMLKCSYDFNGGIDSFCRMEVYRLNDSALVFNGTDDRFLSNQQNYCIFYPFEFDANDEVKIIVRSFNEKGRSRQPYVLNTYVNDLLELNETNLINTILNGNKNINNNNTGNGTRFYFVLFENCREKFFLIENFHLNYSFLFNFSEIFVWFLSGDSQLDIFNNICHLYLCIHLCG